MKLFLDTMENNNFKFPPIFVINLPKDKDRKDFMDGQLKDMGMEYEFIEGRLGTDTDVIASCDDDLAIKEHGKILTKGEKGCAYSHRFVYEKMLKENIKVAVIMEDDVVIPKNFKEIIEKEISRKNRNWDWLSFDYPLVGFRFVTSWIQASIYMTKNKPIFFLYALAKFPFIVVVSIFDFVRDILAKIFPIYAGPKIFYRPLYNAGAYMITEEGIKKMKPLLYPIRFSADRTPNRARVKLDFTMRWYVPRVVHQMLEDDRNRFPSNTLVD